VARSVPSAFINQAQFVTCNTQGPKGAMRNHALQAAGSPKILLKEKRG
jgi:hypothetical protein